MSKSKIIDPTKLRAHQIPPPILDEIRANTANTVDYVGCLNREIDRAMEQSETPSFFEFIATSLNQNLDLLLSAIQIPARYGSSHLILMRPLVERFVDFVWVFSKYQANPIHGENLSKRWKQIASNDFLRFSNRQKDLLLSEPELLKAMGDEFEKRVSSTRRLHLIDLVDPLELDPVLKGKQKSDWRALPGLIKSREELGFNARANIAASIVQGTSNLKGAPFNESWKVLNQFSHTSAFSSPWPEPAQDILFRRSLGIMLGFVHDMINIGYNVIRLPIPHNVQITRVSRMLWFST